MKNPDTPPGAALLQATIREMAPHFGRAENLNGSGDRRDLYWLIDYLGYAVDQAYPRIPCANGCSECCDNQVFRVSTLEWAEVRQGLLALDTETRALVVAHAVTVYGPYREALEGLAAAWTAGERGDPALHKATPITCPALVNGRCSVYHERPAICRAYGYFSATVDDKPSILMCKQRGPAWLDYLMSTGTEQLPMPSWNPVQRHLEALNGGQPIKPLPLWILDEEAALSVVN